MKNRVDLICKSREEYIDDKDKKIGCYLIYYTPLSQKSNKTKTPNPQKLKTLNQS